MLFWFCLFLPLVGTVLGAAAVFFIKRGQSATLAASLDGLAGGVMTASAIFSLLLPAFESAPSVLSPLCGLLFGFLFFLAAERLSERLRRRAPSQALTVFAITLHNLPEGMAVGIALCGLLVGAKGMTVEGVLALSAGIAIQNIPEGAIVSLPQRAMGKGKGNAFFSGVLSGVVEPIGALLALLLSELAIVLLPFFLSFAAAAMLSVVVGELSESFQGDGGRWGRISFAVGFVLMTALDVLFG